jgi:hypothetical protein
MAAAMGTIILGTLIAGKTAYDVASDRKAAKGAKKLGEFEGAMFDEAAADALARGTEETFRIGAAARQLTGSQRVSQAAGGVDIASGSAADVISSDARLAELDILTVKNNAEREARGLQQQGEFARMGGKNAAAGYRNRAYGTLLGGAADLYRVYDRYGINRTTNTTVVPRAGDNSGGYGQR